MDATIRPCGFRITPRRVPRTCPTVSAVRCDISEGCHARLASVRPVTRARNATQIDDECGTLVLFVLAAFAEIRGAWLVWQGAREHWGLI